jgi:transketolase
MEYNRKKIVKKIVEICHKKKEGHIPSSLSIIDILFSIYDFVDLNLIKNQSPIRDRIILSKGHASLGLYSILDNFDLLEEPIENFCDFNSSLGGHPSDKIKYVECSTGSLGHGLPISVGMSLSYKINKVDQKIFTIIGDGELNEGSMWESLLLASHHKLNNLICILDFNHSGDRALLLGDIFKKIKSFDWDVFEVDGNDVESLKKMYSLITDKPLFLIANTIKGKGIELMENNPEWHHKSPNEIEFQQIIKELL